VVVNKTTVINVNNVHWANAERRNAVVGVKADQFGRGRVNVEHFDAARVAKLRPLQGDVGVKPGKASLAPNITRGERPPRAIFDRTVVATREARRRTPDEIARTAAPMRGEAAPAQKSSPGLFGRSKQPEVTRQQEGTAARIVTPPKRGSTETLHNRPPFGTASGGERSSPPQPPRFRERPTQAPSGAAAQNAMPRAPSRAGRSVAPPQREVREPSAPRGNLPGEPANRVFRGRPVQPPRMETPAAPQRAPQVQRPSPQHGREPQGQHGGGNARQPHPDGGPGNRR
jgi:hypothetical protein